MNHFEFSFYRSVMHQICTFFFTLLFTALTVSCGVKSSIKDESSTDVDKQPPPAYIQKAWNARYQYESDRRLLIPKYAGSRWGAVQQYKEDGSLEYQDWWVKDLHREDLDASPPTLINTYIDEDGNLTEVSLGDLQKEENLPSNLPSQAEGLNADTSKESLPLPEQEPQESNSLNPFSPFGP